MRAYFAFVVLVGCAGGLTQVPEKHWQTVPQDERTTIDRAHDAELMRAHTELKLATLSLADAERQPKVVAHPVVKTSDDDERLKGEAVARIDTARLAYERANLEWRRARVDAATSRIDVVLADRQLDRARAVDRHMPSSETYELDVFRGQVASAQEQWYSANARAITKQTELVRASANLTSAKEEYAQIVRRTAPPSAQLTLSVFSPQPTRRCRSCAGTYLTIK